MLDLCRIHSVNIMLFVLYNSRLFDDGILSYLKLICMFAVVLVRPVDG
jgi:hypothetical protein